MAIVMGKGCIEAIYGLMGWKGPEKFNRVEGGGAKSFAPAIFQFCSPHLPLINDQVWGGLIDLIFLGIQWSPTI